VLRPYVLLFVAAAQFALAACVTTVPAGPINAFTTDGCSLFPDRSLIAKEDWCHCCIVHDLAYWRGGTAAERKAADEQLRTCVAGTTGNTAMADLMYAGIRTGGGPYFYTPYRWGYGWPYGRDYQKLTSSEQSSAAAQEAIYRESNPALSCLAK
jgi:hypothetical protein